MWFPGLHRTNMRYRGPMESEKLNRFVLQMAHNLKVAGEALDELRRRTEELVKQHKAALENESINLSRLARKIEHLGERR